MRRQSRWVSSVHYYVHGRGRGHATRSAGILRALAARGHRVRVFVGSDANALLPNDFDIVPVTSLPHTMALATAAIVAERIRQSISALRSERPDVLVSDGDAPSLWASGTLGVPAIAVGRGLAFSHCRRPSEIMRRHWGPEAVKAWVSSRGARRFIAVSFAPLRPLVRGVVLAKPTPPGITFRGGSSLLCYFRDGNGAQILEALVALGERPIVFGSGNPHVAGVDYRGLGREAFLAALGGARAVVASAGSQLLGEAAHLGVPVFAVHRADDHEQAINAALARIHGLGEGASFDEVGPAALGRFLDHVDEGKFSPVPWNAPWVHEAVLDQLESLLCREVA